MLKLQAQSVMVPNEGDQQLQEFQTSRVAAAKLPAFSKRGKQKLKDFFAYWTLMANQDYPLEMREEALDAGVACFNKQAKLNFSFLGRKNRTPESLLKQAIAGKLSVVELVELKPQAPLQWTGKQYEGQLSFSIKRKGKQERYIVDLELQKVKKKFGHRTEFIWEVQLGDINPLP